MIIDTNKNSWHLELYEMGGGYKYGKTDICQYTRHVWKGVGLSVIFILLGVVAGLMIIEPIADILIRVFGTMGWTTFLPGGLLFLALDAVVLFIVCLYCIETLWKSWRRRREEFVNIQAMERAAEPGYLRLLFRSWKEKACFIIEFKE